MFYLCEARQHGVSGLSMAFISNYLVQVSCVITLLAWIAGLLLLIVRCATHADFQVISSEAVTPESETTQLNSSQSQLIPKRDQNPLIAIEVTKG